MTQDQARELNAAYFGLYHVAAQAGDWPLANAYHAGHSYLEHVLSVHRMNERIARGGGDPTYQVLDPAWSKPF